MRRCLVLLAMLGVTGAAFANAPPAAPPACAVHWRMMMRHMEQRRMERLTVLLGLSPAQQAQVRTILAAERVAARRGMRQAMRQMRASHEAVCRQTLSKLSSVLSPEQLRKFKLLLPGRMPFMHHPGMGPGAPFAGPPGR